MMNLNVGKTTRRFGFFLYFFFFIPTARRLFPINTTTPPRPSIPPPSLPTPPIKTAGWSNARLHPRAAHRRGFRAANRAICVSYPLHERQRKDRDAHRRPVHSIRASESREAAAYPRYSPVTSLPHPLPPSAVGETARAQPLRQTTRRKHGLHPGGTFRIKRASSKQLVWR